MLKFCNLTHSKAIHHFIPIAHSLPTRDVPPRWQVTQQSQLPVFIQLLLWQCLTYIHAMTCPDSDGWGQHLGFTYSGAGWPGALAAPLVASGHLGISVYICDTECTSAHCSVMCNGVFSPSVVSFHTKSCKMFTKIFMLKHGLYFYNR